MTVKLNFKKEPFEHQKKALVNSYERQEFGYFMEMGTGKSKVLLDDMALLFLQQKINFALIIAPKGVYRNWIDKEIPEHMSEDIPHRTISWVAAPNKKQQAEMQSVKNPFNGLTVFVMNVEAFSTAKGRAAGLWFAAQLGEQGLIAVDESTTIKNHKAKRTKSLLKISEHFRYRRLLTGSPITKSPMDIFSQSEFLRPGLLGHESFYTFQARYAVMHRRTTGSHAFNQIVGFKNLDELTDKIDMFSYRVLKKDCLDLPDKVYTARYVTLTDEQFKMYRSLKEEALILLDNYQMVTAPAVITQMLRIQQVLSGHLKTDDGEMKYFPTRRLDALLEILEEHNGKAIIWSRFRHDIKSIVDALGSSAAAYYGDTADNERSSIVKRFQAPDSSLKYFVGNPATAGYGLTLTEANLVVYYANDFNLETRIQSEDRCHRIGQKNNVTYVDLISEGTIDEKIVTSLRNKINLSAKVLGEQAKEWLTLTPKK